MVKHLSIYRYCVFGGLIPLLVFGVVGLIIDNSALMVVGVIGTMSVWGIALERRRLQQPVVTAATEATAITAAAIVITCLGVLGLKYTVANSLGDQTLYMTAVLFGATAFIPSMKRALSTLDDEQ